MIRILIYIILISCISAQSSYIMKFIQAAPGEIKMLKEELKKLDSDLLLQHKQGENWDFLVIKQIDLSNFSLQRNSFIFSYDNPLSKKISKQEEIIASGPDYDIFKKTIQDFPLFHLESFDVIPGKEKELYREREMENKYFKEVNFDGNFIFTRIFGSEWDLITLGYYKSFTHFASQEEIPFDKDDFAAKQAGFKGVDYIGSYLRGLIIKHQDTIAKKVK
jgi:hypothetical protein